MELTQSVLFSITRVKLSMYEQRIITKIVEYAQISLRGEAPKTTKKKIRHKDPNCHIVLPVATILDEGNDHYNHVYAAARSLMSRRFEYYDVDSGTWHGSPLIYNVTLRRSSGKIDFYVDDCLLQVILDFRRGWKGYDLETALTLPTPAAVRFYVLMSRQCSPLTFKIEDLKEMFGVADKYAQTADFIKKIIEPARKALAAAKVAGFTYARVRDGQKVVALTFFPVAADSKNTPPALTSQSEITIYKALQMYLREYAGFTQRELTLNNKTIQAYAKTCDALSNLQHIDHLSHRANNPKGYIIKSMQIEVKSQK